MANQLLEILLPSNPYKRLFYQTNLPIYNSLWMQDYFKQFFVLCPSGINVFETTVEARYREDQREMKICSK